MTPTLLVPSNTARVGFHIQNNSSSPILIGLCPPTDAGGNPHPGLIHELPAGWSFTQEDAFTYYGPISAMGKVSGQQVGGFYADY